MNRYSLPIGVAGVFAVASCQIPHPMRVLPDASSCAARRHSAVTWIATATPGEREALDEWCSVVGGPIFQTRPRPRLSEHRSDTLVVAVWNVKGGSGDLLSYLRHELQLDCTTPNGPPKGPFQPFVLLVQEAFRVSPTMGRVRHRASVPRAIPEESRDGPRLDIADVASRCGLALAYVPSRRNGGAVTDRGGEDLGNAILSTVPMSDAVAIELPFESSRRVATVATVRLPGGDRVRVASVHLSTFAGAWRTLRTGNTSRFRQALGLIEGLHIAGTLGSAAPANDGRALSGELHPISVVVGGDLNTFSTDESAVRYLWKHLSDSPPLDGLATRGPFPTDHIMFRGGADGGTLSVVPGSYRRSDATYHSDHRGRIVRFLRAR